MHQPRPRENGGEPSSVPSSFIIPLPNPTPSVDYTSESQNGAFCNRAARTDCRRHGRIS
jgi:hypothetical protein